METTIGGALCSEIAGCSLSEVSNADLEDAEIDILKIVQHFTFSLKLVNSNIVFLKECEEVTICIADACAGPPSQSTEEFCRVVK